MKINAGLTFQHTFTLADYSADDYTISGYLTNSSAANALASDLFDGDGTSWELTIPAATTTNYTAGEYMLQLIADDGTNTLLALEVMVSVVATAAAAREVRSANRIILDQLNTIISTKSTQDYDSLTIDGRSITRMKWDEILKAQAHFARLVRAEEQAAAGKKAIGTVNYGFTNG